MCYTRRLASTQREAEIDGLYVLRTSEPSERLSADDTVRGYKNLAVVERLFRTLEGIDILVHLSTTRCTTRSSGSGRIFLPCVLAYYVEWHMRQALAPLLFDDDDLTANRTTSDLAAPARPSAHQTKAVRVIP